MTKVIWIISGPTSVGKSTFIASPRSAELTGLPPGTPVVWASAKRLSDKLGQSDTFLHYNILRPMQMLRRQAQLAGRPDQGFAGQLAEFNQDPAWTEIIEHEAPKTAVVLVAGKQTLLERIRQRRAIEDSDLTGRKVKRYPNEKWERLLEQVDLSGLYGAWRQELRRHGVPYVLVDSDDESYKVVDGEEYLSNILADVERTTGALKPRPATANGENTMWPL